MKLRKMFNLISKDNLISHHCLVKPRKKSHEKVKNRYKLVRLQFRWWSIFLRTRTRSRLKAEWGTGRRQSELRWKDLVRWGRHRREWSRKRPLLVLKWLEGCTLLLLWYSFDPKQIQMSHFEAWKFNYTTNYKSNSFKYKSNSFKILKSHSYFFPLKKAQKVGWLL
jgi:hypothetical protein